MLYNTFNSWLEQMMWKCKIDVGLTSERSDSQDRQTYIFHTVYVMYVMCGSQYEYEDEFHVNEAHREEERHSLVAKC